VNRGLIEWDSDVTARWNACADRDEIREVIARYFVGVDRRDWDLVRTCYHHDAIDAHGQNFDGPADEFVTWMSDFVPRTGTMTMHYGFSPLIVLDGDIAQCETYAIVHHRTHPDEHGVMSSHKSGGRLLDRMERRNGEWRIAHRTLVLEWRDDDVPIGQTDPAYVSA
jgi:hypothetical protein